jgi:hypothetical protein
VVNVFGLISSKGNRGAQAEQLRTDAALRTDFHEQVSELVAFVHARFTPTKTLFSREQHDDKRSHKSALQEQTPEH